MGWIVKTLLLCFIVGFALSVLDVEPATILTSGWAAIGRIAELAVELGGWALPYILLGAVIVVPLSLLAAILRWTRTRSRP